MSPPAQGNPWVVRAAAYSNFHIHPTYREWAPPATGINRGGAVSCLRRAGLLLENPAAINAPRLTASQAPARAHGGRI